MTAERVLANVKEADMFKDPESGAPIIVVALRQDGLVGIGARGEDGTILMHSAPVATMRKVAASIIKYCDKTTDLQPEANA